jgi:hypothetical protein
LASASRTLLVYDSRIPESAGFAAASSHNLRHDLAQGRIDPRRMGAIARVEGLTRRSDYVALSLALRLNGMRSADDRPSPAPISARDHLFRWTLTKSAKA